MRTWLESIGYGLKVGVILLPVVMMIYAAGSMLVNKKSNYLRCVINGLFALYMSCVFALVFLPLPSLADGNLPTQFKGQVIPFLSVYNVSQDPSVEGVCQILFNIVMTVPFGVYFAYYFGADVKKVAKYSFALSLMIEVAQLTGLFFIFKGSYRLFDVDDLMCNTLGGVIGAVAVAKCTFLPVIAKYDVVLAKLSHRNA